MEIIMLTVGHVCTNCYISHQEGTNSCVVIDPGDEAKKIADQIRKNGWGWENFIKEANTGKGKHIPDGLRSYMAYVVPALICFIYLKGYYDTFSNRSLPVLIGWMCFAVILLVLIFWATFSKSKKNLENPIDK